MKSRKPGRKPKPINYKGAGVAVFCSDSNGVEHILLGKRLHSPGRGTWSFPGGQADDDSSRAVVIGPVKWRHYTESYFDCAFRELFEEVVFWGDIAKRYTRKEIGHPFWFRLPGWRWDTYRLRIENPDLRLPVVNTAHTVEFSQLKWYPVKGLPEPLHAGVRWAVANLAKS